MPQNERLVTLKVLLVDDEFLLQTAAGRATRALVEELQQRDVEVLTATAVDDAMSIVISDPSYSVLHHRLGTGQRLIRPQQLTTTH